MQIDDVVIGATVSMLPQEVLKAAGDGPVRLVTCPNGRVMGGIGVVGFAEHNKDTDLQEFIDRIKGMREALEVDAAKPLPDNPRAALYTFVRI